MTTYTHNHNLSKHIPQQYPKSAGISGFRIPPAGEDLRKDSVKPLDIDVANAGEKVSNNRDEELNKWEETVR